MRKLLNVSCRLTAITAFTAMIASPAVAQQATTYHLAHQYTVGGASGWDYLTLDTASNRLFITRTDRAMVVDPHTGRVLGEIPGLNRGHGVAFAYREGHGFVTSGEDGTVTMFDLKTLNVLGKTVVCG